MVLYGSALRIWCPTPTPNVCQSAAVFGFVEQGPSTDNEASAREWSTLGVEQLSRCEMWVGHVFLSEFWCPWTENPSANENTWKWCSAFLAAGDTLQQVLLYKPTAAPASSKLTDMQFKAIQEAVTPCNLSKHQLNETAGHHRAISTPACFIFETLSAVKAGSHNKAFWANCSDFKTRELCKRFERKPELFGNGIVVLKLFLAFTSFRLERSSSE